MIRRRIVFSGYVQGVGFRWRACKAAELYGCTGWVRNDWDGTVTMEIQGTEEQIDAVILAIERGRYVRIENMDSRTLPVDRNESGFRTE
ncbi:MAG: acylphosphatase [Clostridiales bacterium]|nr:acylphosphatase [Clostridiales bacterium]